MKLKYKLLFIIFFVLLCIFILFFKFKTENDFPSIVKKGVILVGTTGDYRPMSFFNKETNSYEGFDIALIEDFASNFNLKIKYIPTSWQTLMKDTQEKKFDIALSGITINDERKDKALMSAGYLKNGKTVLCRIEDRNKYTNIKSINNPNVRVMENPGGLNEKFVRENLPNAKLTIHNVNEEIPGLIAENKADVMITEVMEANFYTSKDKRLIAPISDKPFTSGQIGALIPKNKTKLLNVFNEFLQNEKQSGRLDEIEKLYIKGI